jgi:hypothetical protein
MSLKTVGNADISPVFVARANKYPWIITQHLCGRSHFGQCEDLPHKAAANNCNLPWPRYCYHTGLGLADKTVLTQWRAYLISCKSPCVSLRQIGPNSHVSHGNYPAALMYGTRDIAVARSRLPSPSSGRTLLNPLASWRSNANKRMLSEENWRYM